MQFDQMDKKILRILQREGRIKISELSDKVGLSQTPCSRRVAILEKNKIIDGYGANVDQSQVGLPLSIFVSVELEDQHSETLEKFEDTVKGFDEVMECYMITGSQDFLMRVVASDLPAYDQFLHQHLSKVHGIRSIRSRFALRQVVKRRSLPLHKAIAQ